MKGRNKAGLRHLAEADYDRGRRLACAGVVEGHGQVARRGTGDSPSPSLPVYVDAVEWVELPNTLGMSQHPDGGLMASKRYVASGKYIQRMSNYCATCRYDPARSTGDNACPFTTLYWDFLLRHEKLLAGNQRMAMQMRNLKRLSPAQHKAIRARADEIRLEQVLT